MLPRETPVREVMTADVITVAPTQSVADAARLLTERRIGAAPVVSDGKLIGMLDDDDLIVEEARIHFPTTIAVLDTYLMMPGSLARFERELKKAVGATVADVMDDEFESIGPDDTLEQAASVMHERSTTHLPVVDGDRLVGIIARGDVVRALVT
jgi:CBS domain-containing protein